MLLKQKLFAGFFILALAAQLACATSFNMFWDSSDSMMYFQSDVVASPHVSAPSYVCAGQPVTVNFTSSSSWNTQSLSAGTASDAVLRSSLSAAPAPANNYAVTWLSPSQSNALYTYVNPTYLTPRFFVWSPTNQWGTFMGGQGISPQENNVGIYYECPNGILHYFGQDGGDNCVPAPTQSKNFLAYSALFCNAKANIQVSNGGPSYSDDFYGSQITKTVTLPLGTYTINSQLAVQRCMASARSDGTFNTKTGYVYIQDSFQPSFSAPTTTVIVENPFVCAIAATNGQYSPPNPTPGSTVSFSFDLNNPGNRPLTINSGQITLSSGSIFQNLQITSPSYPITVPQGGSVHITGTVLVPVGTSPGSYPLNLNINSQTSSADCSGSVKTCNVPAAFIVNINVGSGNTYSCSIGLNPSTIIGPGSSTATATCLVNGVAGACANSITWGTTFGSITPIQPSPFTSATLSAPQVASSTPGTVTASYSVGSTPVQCSAAFTVQPPSVGPQPDYIPVLSTQTAIVGQPFVAPIITRNQGTAACGNVSQTDSAFNGNQFASFTVQPLGIGAQQSDTHTFTCPTTPGNYTLAANVDSTNQCAESNEGNNYATVQIRCITAPPPTGATNCTLSSNHGVDYQPSEQGIFTATCTNFTGQTASCPSLGWSSGKGSMNPTSTPPAAQPQSTFTAGSSQGAGTVVASAANFSCSSPVNIVNNPYGNMNLTCDFENHPAPAVFFPGETDNARAFCQNSPDCPPLAWSNNLVGTTLQYANTPEGASPILNLFSVSPTAPAPQSGGVTVRCANPSQCNATCTAALNISQIPNRLDCSLVNHSTGGLFTINDWSYVRGRCSIDGVTITACPRLNWMSPRTYPSSGTLTGSAFSPNPTLQSVDPLTNFSITNGVKGERGYIDALSASPIVPGLRCNATIGVNVTDIGPDYQIVVLTVSNPIPKLHDTVRLTIWTQNTGNQNATGASITQTVVAPSDCTPDRYSVPGLHVGEIDKHTAYTYTCTCETPGRHIVTATANADRNIFETNYDNNARSTVFYCATNYTLSCVDYV
ncbi:Uncharacterised protein [uncultured archaeon]|nr:Uncharacterised protein [uncultured archaeon]